MAATVADIARHVGVATSTAADILRGRPGYSPQTCQRIMEAAKQLDFVPNHMAKSLLTRRSNTIGIVGNVLDMPLAVEMLKAISESLLGKGFMPLFVETSVQSVSHDQAVRELRGRAVDGLILRGEYDDQELHRFVPRGTPCVTIRSKPSAASACPGVVADRSSAIADGVRWLADRGHERIAFIGFDNASAMLNPFNSHRLKIEGYLAGMASLGLGDDAKVIDVDFGFGAVRTFVRQNVELFRSLTAVIASNDQVAIELMTGLAAVGLRVPKDCSVIGFDDSSFALAVDPCLTTFQPKRAEVGAKASEMILDLIAGRKVRNATIVPELIERESVRTIRRR